MKLKITIWIEDTDVEKLTAEFKAVIKNELEEYFIEIEKPVKQIEIEEIDFED